MVVLHTQLIFCSCKLNLQGLCYFYTVPLAEKGILTDSLFTYPQKGKSGLYAPWDRTIPTAFAIQKVCYNYGDIAFAQKFAFEGNVLYVTLGLMVEIEKLIN